MATELNPGSQETYTIKGELIYTSQEWRRRLWMVVHLVPSQRDWGWLSGFSESRLTTLIRRERRSRSSRGKQFRLTRQRQARNKRSFQSVRVYCSLSQVEDWGQTNSVVSSRHTHVLSCPKNMYVDRRDCVGGPGQEVALQRNSGYAAEVCLFFSSAKNWKKINWFMKRFIKRAIK